MRVCTQCECEFGGSWLYAETMHRNKSLANRNLSGCTFGKQTDINVIKR